MIPAALSHALNFHSGDTPVMRIIDGELHIVSVEKLIKSTQELIKSRRTDSGSMVDELIKLDAKKRLEKMQVMYD